MTEPKEKSRWNPVKELMIGSKVTLGNMTAYQFKNSPRRVLFSMSYYKFTAKLIGSGKRVLDVGCGEGLGTWLLATECGRAKGVDLDRDSIEIAKNNWNYPESISFECADFLELPDEQYDAVVAFDVIEHILPENAGNFNSKITANLSPYGIAIVGTPNITAQKYASTVSNAGHVNLYSAERLEKEMQRYFTQVFMFGVNDELVHTGFLPMAHYLIAVGCRKRGTRESN